MTGKRVIVVIPASSKNPYTVKKSGRKIELFLKVQSLYNPHPAA